MVGMSVLCRPGRPRKVHCETFPPCGASIKGQTLSALAPRHRGTMQQPFDEQQSATPTDNGGGLLPPLRMDLDFQPSPAEDQPGLLVRDSFRYSDTTLIIPPYLLRFLPFFDGQHTQSELLAELRKVTSADNAQKLEAHLRETLENAGFLLGERFDRLRQEARKSFTQSPVRLASHAGAAYPEDPHDLRSYLGGNLNGYAAPAGGTTEPFALAAPHISFEGGWQSYAAMASRLQHADPASLFVVMGTSHYGEPGRIGVTAKPFRTPLGQTQAVPDMARAFAESCPEAVILEDYSHSIDHSVEFHVLLLQYILRPDVTVLPLLVGAFLEPMENGGLPDDSPALRDAFQALRELADQQNRKLVWLLSVDMAHMGKRYGDDFEAIAMQGKMSEVEELDRTRIGMLRDADSQALWKHVNAHDGDLKWCGSSTLYTFQRIYPEARASLLSYQQWNIDSSSVVSFGTLDFTR
jgi:MEMO1 family protein